MDHAFFNDEREVYDEAAANDAWERVRGFFARHLAVELGNDPVRTAVT